MINCYDIGINLSDKQFNGDRNKIIENAYNNGIGLIITGCGYFSNKTAIDIAKTSKYPIYCTLGIHPHNAKDYNENYIKNWYDLYNNNKSYVVAVGEIGLDYDRMFSPKDVQIDVFQKMINVARDVDLPLFLHERSAVNDFYSILKDNIDIAPNSVVHCFTGCVDSVKKYLDLGCMIGITGWICDTRRNSELVDAIKYIPLDRLMIETDAPYLTPYGYKLPRRNVPTNLHYVYEEIAKLIGVSPNEVREKSFENTKRFFRI